MALGPTLGGLLISGTGNILSVFYVTAMLHTFYLLMAVFVVPESLTKEAALANIEAARVKAEQDTIILAKQEETMTPAQKRIYRILRTAFFPLSPLAIFIPRKVEGSRRRDWNLTAIAITYGLIVLLVVRGTSFHAELASNIRVSAPGFIPIQIPICQLYLSMGLGTIRILAQCGWSHARNQPDDNSSRYLGPSKSGPP
jgi:hypothetical protein